MSSVSEMYPAGIPRINHVAMSVTAELLTGAERAELLEMYRHCFGWTEIEQQAEEARIAVMAVGHWDQFVFLHAEPEPMSTVRLDHFGISVRSTEDFDACWERVASRHVTDERIDVIEPHVDDFGPVKIHAFYMRFRLPLMVEVQYWELT